MDHETHAPEILDHEARASARRAGNFQSAQQAVDEEMTRLLERLEDVRFRYNLEDEDFLKLLRDRAGSDVEDMYFNFIEEAS